MRAGVGGSPRLLSGPLSGPPIRPGPGLPAWSSGVSPQPALGFPLEAAPGLRLSLRSPPGAPEPACHSLEVSPPRLGATPRTVGGGPGDLTGPSGALADRPCSNQPSRDNRLLLHKAFFLLISGFISHSGRPLGPRGALLQLRKKGRGQRLPRARAASYEGRRLMASRLWAQSPDLFTSQTPLPLSLSSLFHKEG